MSITRNLVNGYGSFFVGVGAFAVLPYTATFIGVGSQPHGGFDLVAATLAVGVLTFLVPVLPTLFSITSTLAMVAASIAIASMFILFPTAFIADLAVGNLNVENNVYCHHHW